MSANAGTDAQVTVTIEDVLWLNIDGEPLIWEVTGSLGHTWFGWGNTNPKGIICQIQADTDWEVQIRGVEAEFNYSGSYGASKEREDIRWHNGGDQNFVPLPSNWTYVATGGPGDYWDNSDGAPPCTFYILLDWASDFPGSYTYTVSFQIIPI